MYTFMWLEYTPYNKQYRIIFKSSEEYKSREGCYDAALKVKPQCPCGVVHVLVLNGAVIKSYVDRLDTYANYPRYLLPKKEKLARAGLHYTGVGDITQCSLCRIHLSDWKAYHDPLTRHNEAYSRCPFVIASATAKQRNLDVI